MVSCANSTSRVFSVLRQRGRGMGGSRKPPAITEERHGDQKVAKDTALYVYQGQYSGNRAFVHCTEIIGFVPKSLFDRVPPGPPVIIGSFGRRRNVCIPAQRFNADFYIHTLTTPGSLLRTAGKFIAITSINYPVEEPRRVLSHRKARGPITPYRLAANRFNHVLRSHRILEESLGRRFIREPVLIPVRGNFMALLGGLSDEMRVFLGYPTDKKTGCLGFGLIQNGQKLGEVAFHTRRQRIPGRYLWSRGQIENVEPVFHVD